MSVQQHLNLYPSCNTLKVEIMSDKPNEASIWQLHNHCQKEALEDRLDYSKRLRSIALQWLLIPGVTAQRCFISK